MDAPLLYPSSDCRIGAAPRGRGRMRCARPVPPRFTGLRGLGRKSARPSPPGVLGCGRLLCKAAVNAWRGMQTPSPVNQIRGKQSLGNNVTAEGPRRPLCSGRGMRRPRTVAAEWSPSSGCCAAGLPPVASRGGAPRARGDWRWSWGLSRYNRFGGGYRSQTRDKPAGTETSLFHRGCCLHFFLRVERCKPWWKSAGRCAPRLHSLAPRIRWVHLDGICFGSESGYRKGWGGECHDLG